MADPMYAPKPLEEAFLRVWGDDPPGRWLARTSAWALFCLLAYSAAVAVMASVESQPRGTGLAWASTTISVLQACLCLCWVDAAGRLYVGMRARGGRTAPFAAPACCAVAFVALSIGQHATVVAWAAVADSVSPLPLLVAFQSLRAAVVVALVVTAVPLLGVRAAPPAHRALAQAQTEETQRGRHGRGEGAPPARQQTESQPLAEEAEHGRRGAEESPSARPQTESQAQPPSDRRQAPRVCSACGSAMSAAARFCGVCGKEVPR